MCQVNVIDRCLRQATTLGAKFACFASVFAIGSVAYSCPGYADTDIINFINAALAKKNIMLQRNWQVTSEKIVCTVVGDGRPHEDCQTIQYTYTQTYQDIARVISQQVLSVSQLQFDQTNITQLPAIAFIERLNYANCGSDQFNPSFNLSVTGTEGHSVAKTQSVSTTAGIQVNQTFTAGNGLFGGSTAITTSFSMTFSQQHHEHGN